MVKPASLSRLTGSLTCLALLVGSTSVFAQQVKPVDDKKTESEEAVFIPVEYRPPPYQVSVGVRLSGKAKVKFSNLGTHPGTAAPDAYYQTTTTVNGETTTTKEYSRSYDDGGVYRDATVNIDGTRVLPTGDKVGTTNYWEFTNSNQVVNVPNVGKALALHAYSLVSTGGDNATADASRNSSLAWDVEVSREIGSNRRMSWGLILGAGISNISCGSSKTVKARLRTRTDYYSLENVTLWTISGETVKSYGGSQEAYQYFNGAQVYKPDGTKATYWPTELRIKTDPITGIGTDVTEDTASASIDVVGQWNVNGAYMTLRFGPYFAYQLTRRLSVKASAGFTFSVVGASLRISEKAFIPAKASIAGDNTSTAAYLEINTLTRSLPHVNGLLGYFASCELDAFLTDRTGIFLGASQEGFHHDLTLKDPDLLQQADIALSSGTVLRTGITTRF